jgi:hypothetical protein
MQLTAIRKNDISKKARANVLMRRRVSKITALRTLHIISKKFPRKKGEGGHASGNAVR